MVLFTYDVTDISPLRVLTGVHTLSCAGSNTRKGKLKDIGPLRTLRLQWFNCAYTQVEDLSPLAGMPLRTVNVLSTPRQPESHLPSPVPAHTPGP